MYAYLSDLASVLVNTSLGRGIISARGVQTSPKSSTYSQVFMVSLDYRLKLV